MLEQWRVGRWVPERRLDAAATFIDEVSVQFFPFSMIVILAANWFQFTLSGVCFLFIMSNSFPKDFMCEKKQLLACETSFAEGATCHTTPRLAGLIQRSHVNRAYR
jgi:hypothetical protein